MPIDPISLTVGAKLFFLLKQYLFIIPMVKKGLLELMREARAAKQIELNRMKNLKERIPASGWYAFVFIRYLCELGFYLTIIHSVVGVHTLWLSLLFCVEDWLAYWLTILVPYWFANYWERQLGITTAHAKVIDLMVDPAHAEQRAREPVKTQ